MITYSPVKKAVQKTLGETKYTSILDVSLIALSKSKVVGQIYQGRVLMSKGDTFVYIPKGKKTGGDEFTSLAACQRSLA